MILGIIIFRKKFERVQHEHFLSEIYFEFKQKTWAKLFHAFFLIRRFIIVLIIVTLKDINSTARLTLFVFCQALQLFYVVLTRPFDSIYKNIIEILNESMFFLLSIFTLIFNSNTGKASSMGKALIYLVL